MALPLLRIYHKCKQSQLIEQRQYSIKIATGVADYDWLMLLTRKLPKSEVHLKGSYFMDHSFKEHNLL